MKPTQGRKSLVGGSTSQPPTLKPPHSNSSLSISNLASPKVPPLNQSGYQHKRNDSSSSRVIGATSLKTSSVQKNQILTSRSHSEQKALPNEKVYEAFRKREVQDIQKSSVLLSKVYYMLDNKCIAYKMECEVDYIMSFLTKKDETVRADALNILLKLCCNQEVANELMKDQNFHYLIEQCQFNKHEEVRSICFKIFGNLSNNQSKHVIKQLYYSSNLINKLPQIFAQEQSEDVLCSMFLFITKLTTDDIYLELITQEPELLAQILTYMNYKKNQRLRLLAYKVLINLLCIDEMRKVILKQTKLDVLAKLISIIDKGENTEDIIHALEALTNALQDYTVMVSFLQQKGHVSLAQVFEKEEIRIKEKCLALYTRLAQQRPEIPQGTPPLMMVVMDADLISDVLSLPLNEKKNIQVIRNMLLLIQVMLLGRNEQAVEQMKVFDIIYLLMNLVTGDTQLSYLALGCLSLLARRQDFKALILDKNLQGASVLQTISKGLTLLCASNNPQVLKFFIRSLHVYLLSFDRIEGDHLELDHIISLIQALTTAYECQEDMNGQYYAVLALKRLSEMGNQHISIIINSNEQLAQQLDDAPTLYRTQQEGFINDILEQDISKYLTYFAVSLQISNLFLD